MKQTETAQGEGPQPMTTMFVRPVAKLEGDEVVKPEDKRYPVLSRLAAHNGFGKSSTATVLVRRRR